MPISSNAERKISADTKLIWRQNKFNLKENKRRKIISADEKRSSNPPTERHLAQTFSTNINCACIFLFPKGEIKEIRHYFYFPKNFVRTELLQVTSWSVPQQKIIKAKKNRYLDWVSENAFTLQLDWLRRQKWTEPTRNLGEERNEKLSWTLSPPHTSIDKVVDFVEGFSFKLIRNEIVDKIYE